MFYDPEAHKWLESHAFQVICGVNHLTRMTVPQLILQGVSKPSGKMQPKAKETGPGLAMEDSRFWLSFPRLLDAPGQ